MDRDELAAWLRLTLTPGVGPITAYRLLGAFGSPQALFAQSQTVLQEHASAAQALALRALPPELDALLAATVAWLEGADTQGPQRAIVPLGDPRYPSTLLETPDPPLLLYLLGPARWVHGAGFAAPRCLALVGSRNPTPQGQNNARQFAAHLCAAGWTIVSGLALGIDTAAHEGALEASLDASSTPATIAVVGTGLDRVYPRSNLALAHRIASQGLVVSEYPLGTPPLAANFPRRNRIIAGLSLGTLVVEAAPASGSLITARLASEQGREVFAIPGSIHTIQARGCHALIRQGAKLVETAQDILEELPPTAAAATAVPACPSSAPALPAHAPTAPHPHAALLDALGFDPVSFDGLQARTGLDTPTLQVQLLELEIDGLLVRMHGGLFQRMARA